jgi:LmbE family N-acetylglucosaminyl deacetylase
VIRFLLPPSTHARRVLAIGAHADDIEIGCGGTLLRLLAEGERLDVTWVVLSAEGARADEARRSASGFLAGADARRVVLGPFRDGFLPYEGAAVKTFFETELKDLDPDVIFTHTQSDAHQDHRLTCELTWNTFRDTLVLEYEIPKYDGDISRPNVYAHLAAETMDTKVALLKEHFGTQVGKDWFEEEVFRSLARLRGMESRAPSGYAEAFHGRKLRF